MGGLPFSPSYFIFSIFSAQFEDYDHAIDSILYRDPPQRLLLPIKAPEAEQSASSELKVQKEIQRFVACKFHIMQYSLVGGKPSFAEFSVRSTHHTGQHLRTSNHCKAIRTSSGLGGL